MLAHVLGGRVWRHPDGLHEVGYCPVLPTAEGADLFESPFHAFQWHRDAFEVPRSCALLARGGEAFENQAFQYGASAFGVQFHPEVTPSTMVKWTGASFRARLIACSLRRCGKLNSMVTNLHG